MINLGNPNINFVDLSSRYEISNASSRTRVIDIEVLDVVPLAVIPHLVNGIEINDSSN